MFTSVYIIFFVISAVFGDDDQQPKLRFYHGSFESYTETLFQDATDMMYTNWYNSSRWTKIICHGYSGNPTGPAMTAIVKGYLEQGSTNIILLNWEHLAAVVYGSISSSYLSWAVPNSIKVGNELADALMNLSQAGMDLNKTHLVGHSLGAQIMGMAGNKLAKKGVVLPWITGLDPAGILFDAKLPQERLNSKSALFVDVIHSDPNKYGSKRSLGTVDFWPNYRNIGAVHQPGCDDKPHKQFSMADLCDHNKSWEYLLDAMKFPKTILGCYAKNYRTWKNYSLEQRQENMLELGKFAPNATPGDYYFTTAAVSPYGLGEDGL